MLNFAEIKEKIAAIVNTEEKAVLAENVSIGFLTRVYEVTFNTELENDIDRETAMKIVNVLGDGVVKTIDYIGFDKKSVVVAFHMN